MLRTGEDILNYIDLYYSRMLERPHMYAASPIALESTFGLLEDIRAFVLNQPEGRSKFCDFIISLGYGVTGIARDPDDSGMRTDDALRRFKIVADVIRQFLESEGRPTVVDDECC